MPPVFGISAPKCPRCGKSVYIAEQAIGPNATPYHKSCLLCSICNKRLDSTLLVEHDGQPLCKNCHRDHLGVGKGGFGKAVPVRATLPTSPNKSQLSSGSGSSMPSRYGRQTEAEEDEEEMMRRVTGMSIRPRARQASSPTRGGTAQTTPLSGGTQSSPLPPRPGNPTPSSALAPEPTSSYGISPASLPPMAEEATDGLPMQSIDDYIASTPGVPNIVSRSSNNESSFTYDDGRASPTRPSESTRTGPAGPQPGQTSTLAGLPMRSRSPERPTATSTPPTARRPLPATPTRPPQAPASTITAAPAASTSSNNGGTNSLPAPMRRMPASTTAPAMKTAPSPMASSPFRSQYIQTSSSSPKIHSAVTSGTPLCARCQKAVYHAEAVHAASGGRIWHRGCLKCEGCGSTLQKGTLEEGPVTGRAAGESNGPEFGEGCNTFCKVCYRRLFGPRGIGVGSSYPIK